MSIQFGGTFYITNSLITHYQRQVVEDMANQYQKEGSSLNQPKDGTNQLVLKVPNKRYSTVKRLFNQEHIPHQSALDLIG